MKNKKIVISIIIIFIMLLLSLYPIHKLTYELDKNAIDHGNAPSYALPLIRMKDGGSVVYYGIGYQVLRWHIGFDTGERKVAYEIYIYPAYKEWEDGPEPTTNYFEYRP
jgi:hypothetical protein